MLEIVDYTLSVEKVHGGAEEIPVQRSSEGQVLCSAGHIGNSNDLLKRNNLYSGDYSQDVDMPSEHSSKKAGDHDQGPYGASDESLLLLLVLRLRVGLFL